MVAGVPGRFKIMARRLLLAADQPHPDREIHPDLDRRHRFPGGAGNTGLSRPLLAQAPVYPRRPAAVPPGAVGVGTAVARKKPAPLIYHDSQPSIAFYEKLNDWPVPRDHPPLRFYSVSEK